MNHSTLIEYAQDYLKKGWQIIPIPFKEKGPRIKNWQNFKVTPMELTTHFDNGPANIGVVLGKNSGYLVDADLDCEEAISLAPYYLPKTLCFGRHGARKSHWLYICEGAGKEVYTFPYGEKNKTLVEMRGDGGFQTVFPGSTHKGTGEKIEFEENEFTEPVQISLKELQERIKKLAIASAWALIGVPVELVVDMNPEDFSCSDMLTKEQENVLRKWVGIKKEKKDKVVAPEKQEELDIREEYNRKFTREYGISGQNTCPICKHNNCFGALPGDSTKWYCFSASHGQVRVDKKQIGVKGSKGFVGDAVDIDAFLAGKKPKEFLIALENSQKKALIEVRIDNRDEMLNKASQILGETGEIFQRGRNLVEIVQTMEAPLISNISFAKLDRLMGKYISWEKWSAQAQDIVACEPPLRWVSMLHESMQWPGIKELLGIATTPIFRPDGSLCTTPGYDERTGLFYQPSLELPELNENPTQKDAEKACDILGEVVYDYPFCEPRHFSAWLSCLCSRVGWEAFEGGSPMTVIDATIASCGKSLLAKITSIIALGYETPSTTIMDDNEELRKQISSRLASGSQIVLFDDVKIGSDIGWPVLNSVLTSNMWEDRRLGSNEMIREKTNAIWIITGNRLNVIGDTRRRCLQILLEAEEEKPEERDNFLHKDLIGWVHQNRARLLTAVYTILLAYIKAGKPKIELKPLGSFEGWSSVIRSAIVYAGMADPGEARMTDEPMDTNKDASKDLVRLWGSLEKSDPTHPGVTLSSALSQIEQEPFKYGSLREAIKVLCPTKNSDLPDAPYLGRKLKQLHRRVFSINGYNVRMESERFKNNYFWRAATVSESKEKSLDNK